MKYSKRLIFSIIGLVAATAGFIIYAPKPSEEHVHIHAGFKVYINDEAQDYSNYKYMNFVPCTEHDTKKSPEEEQIEKAHLHDSVGDVVHVHRSGSKWGDLFRNAKIELPSGSTIKGYIDGKETADILNQPITAYESVVFVVGDSKIDHSQEKVSLDHIKEVETRSELCGAS